MYHPHFNPVQETTVPKESLALTVRQWEQILDASDANGADLAFLETNKMELRGLLERAKSLSIRQAALAAERQQVTRDLDAVKERGRDIATRMRLGIRQQYGEGEKLLEFGLQPRRARD